jgi:hypothetical protein
LQQFEMCKVSKLGGGGGSQEAIRFRCESASGDLLMLSQCPKLGVKADIGGGPKLTLATGAKELLNPAGFLGS